MKEDQISPVTLLARKCASKAPGEALSHHLQKKTQLLRQGRANSYHPPSVQASVIQSSAAIPHTSFQQHTQKTRALLQTRMLHLALQLPNPSAYSRSSLQHSPQAWGCTTISNQAYGEHNVRNYAQWLYCAQKAGPKPLFALPRRIIYIMCKLLVVIMQRPAASSLLSMTNCTATTWSLPVGVSAARCQKAATQLLPPPAQIRCPVVSDQHSVRLANKQPAAQYAVYCNGAARADWSGPANAGTRMLIFFVVG